MREDSLFSFGSPVKVEARDMVERQREQHGGRDGTEFGMGALMAILQNGRSEGITRLQQTYMVITSIRW